MICKSKHFSSLQKSNKYYCFLNDSKFLSLSTWIKDSGLGYTQIGPTILVEWEE